MRRVFLFCTARQRNNCFGRRVKSVKIKRVIGKLVLQIVKGFIAGGGKNPAKGMIPPHGKTNFKFSISQ